jgi:TonB family protein
MCQQRRGVDPVTEVGIFMRRIWPALFLCLISLFSVAVSTPGKNLASEVLQSREGRFTRSLVRAAQFVDVQHISSRPSCGEVQPPEALTTPDPLFTTSAFGHKVKVSFIIGIDGRVHSPLILESGGLAGDRRVLQTVRSWRYRPATCNGVPTETEGKVEFSTR